MKNSKYWQGRFEQIENSSNRIASQVAAETEKMFQEAEKEIEQQISVWYQRFATNNNIKYEDAKKLLKGNDLKELQWSIQEYIKYGEENALNPKWLKELENASAKYHISRLEALKLQTRQTIEALYNNEEKVIDTMVKKVYSDGYYHSMYEIQKGFNIGWDIGTIDQKKLQKIVSTPWATDGKNFSDRIWQSKAQLIQELHSELTRTCILGKAPDAAIKNIAKKFNTSKAQAGRLVMTEQAYFSSVAQKDVFNELDVEQYEIVATLDNRTSAICSSMDGERFPMSEYEPGVTAPPFHPNCRTTTVPAFDDEFDVGERAAKDEDGKTYYVPANIKYDDWKKSFVGKEEPKEDSSKVNNTDKSVLKLLNDELKGVDSQLLDENVQQLNELNNKYPKMKEYFEQNNLIIGANNNNKDVASTTSMSDHTVQKITINKKYYSDYNKLIDEQKRSSTSGWNMACAKDKYSVYTTIHEYGHTIHNYLINDYIVNNVEEYAKMKERMMKASSMSYAMKIRRNFEAKIVKDYMEEVKTYAMEEVEDFRWSTYLSKYGQSNIFEAFAESFANSQCGESNVLGDAMNKFLEERLK